MRWLRWLIGWHCECNGRRIWRLSRCEADGYCDCPGSQCGRKGTARF